MYTTFANAVNLLEKHNKYSPGTHLRIVLIADSTKTNSTVCIKNVFYCGWDNCSDNYSMDSEN